VNVHTAQQASTFRKRLPLGVYVLAFSLFAMGSAEFLVAGVLLAVADDLRISLSAAGALISAFAIGVVIGGPPLAVLTLRWPRRVTLVATQAVFAGAVAIGLLTDHYGVLLATRFACGSPTPGSGRSRPSPRSASSPPTAPHAPPVWSWAGSASR
jgi:MFS transporter, DHA1 family, chloramphenicol resistance protein